jgi:hypothetical protein
VIAALHVLDPFCTWLAATPLSQAIQTVEWIIPAVQTVHILCVASVMSSVLMIDLRLLGIGTRGQTLESVASRFLPFIWWPLPVLLVTGATLIVAEPTRSLENSVFVLKMALLLGAVAVTLIFSLPLRRDASFWELTTARRGAARLLAAVSLPLWAAIIFAGRWIAYTQVS